MLISLCRSLKDRVWDIKTPQLIVFFFIWSHNGTISPKKKRKEEVEPIANRNIAIVHSEYNRHNIQQKKIREMRNETMGLLEKGTNKGGLGIK